MNFERIKNDFLFFLSGKIGIGDEIRSYQLKTLRTITTLTEVDVDRMLLIVIKDGLVDFDCLYETYFKGKEWYWPELEMWREHGMKTGQWLRCFWQKIFRHDFSKDDVSDFFDCISIQKAKKELLAAGALYPKRNIKKTVLEMAEKDVEYKFLLLSIMRESYRSQAYKVLRYTLASRASNARKLNQAMQHDWIRWSWQGVITTETDRLISREIEKNYPDAVFPVIPCDAFDWQLKQEVTDF